MRRRLQSSMQPQPNSLLHSFSSTYMVSVFDLFIIIPVGSMKCKTGQEEKGWKQLKTRPLKYKN